MAKLALNNNHLLTHSKIQDNDCTACVLLSGKNCYSSPKSGNTSYISLQQRTNDINFSVLKVVTMN